MQIEKYNSLTRRREQEPKVWGYLNYREYLKAIYHHKKRDSKGRFSYRLFSIKTGVASPNYLKLIVDGSRNVTPTHARKIAQFCHLTESERDYFLALTRWNQAKKEEERNTLWAEVLRKRASAKEFELSTAQLSILTQSHTIAIFEMLRILPFHSTEEIAARLRQKTSPEAVEESLRQLMKAKVIAQTPKGYQILQKTLHTSEDIPSASIQQFHKTMLSHAANAIESVHVSEREYISTTIAIRKADLPKLKEHIREMRNLIFSETESISNPEEVYQLNIQLFPLTHTKEKT